MQQNIRTSQNLPGIAKRNIIPMGIGCTGSLFTFSVMKPGARRVSSFCPAAERAGRLRNSSPKLIMPLISLMVSAWQVKCLPRLMNFNLLRVTAPELCRAAVIFLSGVAGRASRQVDTRPNYHYFRLLTIKTNAYGH